MQEVLSENEIEEKLAVRPLWKLRNGKLYRNFQAKNFHEAMNFLTTIGNISDTYHHHPDIHLTNYKYIEVELSTPRVHGITYMDFQMADLFDAIPVDYSFLWKHSHPHLVTAEDKPRLPVPPSPPNIHRYETIFPHRAHRPESLVNPLEASSSSIHSQAFSDAPGTVHHSQPFVTTNVAHTPLGQSDIQHHAEVTHSLFALLTMLRRLTLTHALALLLELHSFADIPQILRRNPMHGIRWHMHYKLLLIAGRHYLLCNHAQPYPQPSSSLSRVPVMTLGLAMLSSRW
jgi:4a-hydroxytetrahydrobiopterin dehydratase